MFNARHIAINFGGALLPMIIVIATVPLYLNSIGAEKYGVLSLVWLVFGYFGILDFGVSRAVTMEISRAKNDKNHKIKIIRAAAVLNLAIGLIVAIVATAGILTYTRFSSNAIFAEVAQSLPMLALGVPILMLTATMNGALDGEEKFKVANGLQLVASSLYQLVPLATSYWLSKDISTLIDSVIVARIAVFFMFFASTSQAFGYLQNSKIELVEIKQLLKSGSGIAVVNLLDPIFTRIDQIIVAKFAGVQAVAAYSIAINSVGRIGILPTAMSRSIFPKLSLNSIEENAKILMDSNIKIILIWSLVCGFVIFASDFIFGVWLQNSISIDVSGIAKIFVVGLWANCLAILPYTALQAGGRAMAIARAHVLEIPFYIIALVLFTSNYGAIGTAVAFTLRSVIDYLILWKLCGIKIGSHWLFFGTLIFLTIISIIATRIG